jgi:hypothetical protein
MSEICYVRNISQGHEWTRASQHHQDALLSFLNTPQNPNHLNPIEVSVPYEGQEGNFVTYFTPRMNDTLFYYLDQAGERYQIVRITDPAYLSFLNNF